MKLPIHPSPRNKIRVLVVEDSPVIRDILTHMLQEADDMEIIGLADDGREATRLAQRLAPDVITMDIRMPRMDGLEATRLIMETCPTPIVIVANSVQDSDFNISFKAIEAGALTVVEKPRGLTGSDYSTIQHQLVAAVRMAAGLKVVARWPTKSAVVPIPGLSPTLQKHRIEVIAIAASTGGPATLRQILGQLPKDFSIPIIVVQHITQGFADHMALWLNSEIPISVAVAKAGNRLEAGKVLVAPSDRHMIVTPSRLISLVDSPPVKGQRPSADRLFLSLTHSYRDTTLGIILTGMGDDGADGFEKLSKSGAYLIAQNEQTSVVFGMPAQAIQRGVVDEVLSPDQIASTLLALHKTVGNK
jgi:two-component system chemotaxis response regulator CheB